MSVLGDVLARLDEIKEEGCSEVTLVAALEEARDLLREIEWGGNCADDGPHCPSCLGREGEPGKHRFSSDGHAHDCALAIAIGAPRRAAE